MKKNDEERSWNKILQWRGKNAVKWYGIRRKQQIKHNTIEFRFQNRGKKPKRISDVNANHYVNADGVGIAANALYEKFQIYCTYMVYEWRKNK